jgi:hypothetical protein
VKLLRPLQALRIYMRSCFYFFLLCRREHPTSCRQYLANSYRQYGAKPQKTR